MSLLTDTQAEDPHARDLILNGFDLSGLDFVDMNFADLDNLDLTDWDPTDLLHLLHSPEMATEPVAPSVHTATAVATATVHDGANSEENPDKYSAVLLKARKGSSGKQSMLREKVTSKNA
ncbi:uncharacterized protein LOC144914728 isoform X3 [Branchiostoma floridae x Branchiostoma belcheri]